jgi:hypothetical protein
MSTELGHLYEFASFRLDPKEKILLDDDKPAALTPDKAKQQFDQVFIGRSRLAVAGAHEAQMFLWFRRCCFLRSANKSELPVVDAQGMQNFFRDFSCGCDDAAGLSPANLEAVISLTSRPE